MKNIQIMDTLSRSFSKAKFVIKKHSPEILITAGVVGTVTSAVMACKATLKVANIMEDSKEELEAIHAAAERLETKESLPCTDGSVYTKDDLKKDLTMHYAKLTIEVVKTYAPSVILGTLSLSCVFASNNMLRKRNAALAAAYATIDKGFKEYRNRVVERFGKEVDHELRYNVKAETFEEKVVDEKTGKEKTVTTTVSVADPNEYSMYARFYDDGCRGWSKDPEHNLWQLKQIQSFLNKKLQTQGYLFLNDVYEELGIPKTKAGQIVGWIYDEKNPIGDNFIDFGIYDYNRPAVRDFVNGYERTILLDFNVDGNILDLM